MPRFFFTSDDGEIVDICDEGIDLPSEQAAIDEAQRELVDMVRDKLPDGMNAGFLVVVHNEAGREIYRASLKLDSVKTEGQ
jgi:hypothetical protein